MLNHLTKRKFTFQPTLFFTSASLIVLFVIFGSLFPTHLGLLTDTVQSFIVETFGWFYVGAVCFFLFFVIWLAFSPYGKIRLGKDTDQPEFNYLTWLAMLFSAGMGIGLLFYSVAEPILHYASPPVGEGSTPLAARRAMSLTFFHWGLHAWAIYIVVGLSLAYFSFRRGLPLTISSAFEPLLGKERIHGPIGRSIDILAVVSTMFGIATSLGLGVTQINAGLSALFELEQSLQMQMILIVIITALATLSVASGLYVGVRRLSELNLFLAFILLIFVAIVGPTVFLLNALIQNIGFYLQRLPEQMTWTDAYLNTGWQASWTVFYWGWWIAWSPFVGMFIARISKGRTIREFIVGVLLAPTLLTFVWLTVFGDTALSFELFGSGGLVEAVQESIPTALFVLLDKLPWSMFTSILATVVIVTFFVTSADSGSLVIDIITSGGKIEPHPLQRIFWAVSEGIVAAVLLLAGGLVALQTAAITTGLPFCVVLLFMCWGLHKSLRQQRKLEEVDTDADKKVS